MLLRAAGRRARPWKNGGGTTREVVAFPPGAGIDGFLWRLSIAEVAEPGEFSSFPDVDRVLAVLRGRLDLAVKGRQPRSIAAGDPPLRFAGDAAAFSAPVGGPVMDLNAMVRRGRFTCTMLPVTGGEVLSAAGGATVVVAITGIDLGHQGQHWKLGPLDAFQVDEGDLRISSADAGRAAGFAVMFRPAA